MKTGILGLNLIKEYEGFRGSVYIDGAGHETIGFGHKLTASEVFNGAYINKTITEDQAIQILANDLVVAESVVSSEVIVELSQNQFDALVSFVFNLGSGNFSRSTLLQKLNEGDYDSASSEILRWDKQTDKKTGIKESVPGLARRRKAEADLWNALPPMSSNGVV
jgi:lysozyme